MKISIGCIQSNYESVRRKNDKQTVGDKVYCQKGNNLNQKLKSLKYVFDLSVKGVILIETIRK